jgi:DNA invertase Pin-like site-specific DNA recombinase
MEIMSESENPVGAIAVSYLRVASKDQGDQENGVTVQRDAREREAERVDARIAAEFMDIGVSGNTTSRPGLDHLLAFIRRRPITYLIVSDRSRLARNSADDAAIRQAITQAGVALLSASGETADPLLLQGVIRASAQLAANVRAVSSTIEGSGV